MKYLELVCVSKEEMACFFHQMGSVVILGGLIFVNFPLCIHLC